MNNIEILEEYIKEVWKPKPIHNVITDWATIEKEQIEAIENLIQENKELKEKNQILENLLQGNLFEMYKYYKDLCSAYQGNSVSKDEIKEIIYPTPENPISFEVQSSEMYKKLEKLVEGE